MDDKDECLESENASLEGDFELTKPSEMTFDEDVQNGNEYRLVEDFKSFLNVDVTSKIRTESKDIFFTIAPVLHERCEEIKPLFQNIDQLEKFVSVVRESVDDAEEKVRIAEKEVGSKNIKKILSNVPVPKFLLKKKEIQSYLKKDVNAHDYQGLKRFKTEHYFEPYSGAVYSNEEDESEN